MSAKISIDKKIKLCRPPTSIHTAFGKIYVSTKGKRIFCTEDFKTLKSILFSSQVNSLCYGEDILLCGQNNGALFGLNSKHKTVFKSSVGDSSIILALFNHLTEDFMVASENNKISLYSKEAILKNTFFICETPLICFDISKNNLISAVSQNNQNIHLYDLKTKEKSTLKMFDGYPEIVKFVKDDLLIVGTSTGNLSIFSMINKKRISFHKFNQSITAIHVINESTIVIGMLSAIHLLDISNFNTIEIADTVEIDGIAIDFAVKEKMIYCAISRESRLGRWQKCKEGKNQIVSLKLSK